MTDTDNPGGEKQPEKNKGAKKFDINPEDLEVEDSSLHIRTEDLPADSAATRPQRGPELEGQRRRIQLVYCSKCGHGSLAGSRYCSHCGSKMKKPHSQQPGGQGSGTRKIVNIRKALFLLLGIMLLLLIASGILYFTGYFTNDEGTALTTIYVPGDYETIQEAINASVEGNEIEVAEGTYTENIDFKGKNIVLRSEDPEDDSVVEATVIDGDGNGPVIRFTGGESSNTVLRGFTITGGSGHRERLSLEHIEQENIVGYLGGGILVSNNSKPRIEKNIIEDNFADYGGGILVYEADPIISDNVIKSNHAQFYGGGLLVVKKGSLDLNNNVIYDNSAEQMGGAVWTDDSTIFSGSLETENIFRNNKPDDLADYISKGNND